MGQHDEEQEDELALFRQAMRDVTPLKTSRSASAPARKLRVRASLSHNRRAAVLHESPGVGADLYELQPGDELLFRRNGVPETVLRRLRAGRYRIEAEIDLHGLPVNDATAHLADFLRHARAAGLRCVRVIHGKGLRSGNRGPVIKNTVNALLRRCDRVMAFASARPAAGGTGATLVLLSRA
jgi:DNA-nicking Smr family endonuclease